MFSVLHYRHAQGLNHSKKYELKMMTLCAKSQCYFSLAMSSLILHAHTFVPQPPALPFSQHFSAQNMTE